MKTKHIGSGHPKLKAKNVKQIRKAFADGEQMKCLAIDFNVDNSTIWHIVNFKTWKNL